uniref:Uncharacterized protein n=1 Tax=Laticauda laticaudata TaxID=8630 RepID=A0A8C5RNA3_LATLA
MYGKSADSWNPFFLQSKLSGKRKSITFYRSGVSNLGSFQTCGLQLPEFFSQQSLILKVTKVGDRCHRWIPMETSSLSDDSCDHFGSNNFANTIARKLLDCWLLFSCAVYS